MYSIRIEVDEAQAASKFTTSLRSTIRLHNNISLLTLLRFGVLSRFILLSLVSQIVPISLLYVPSWN